MCLDLMVYIFIACVIYSFILMSGGSYCSYLSSKFLKNKFFSLTGLIRVSGATGDIVGLALTQSLTLTSILQLGVVQSEFSMKFAFC